MGVLVLVLVLGLVLLSVWFVKKGKIGSRSIRRVDDNARQLGALEKWYFAERATGCGGVFAVVVDVSSAPAGFDPRQVISERVIDDNPYLRFTFDPPAQSSSSPQLPAAIRFVPAEQARLQGLYHVEEMELRLPTAAAAQEALEQLVVNEMLRLCHHRSQCWRYLAVRLAEGGQLPLYRLIFTFHHLIGDATAGVHLVHQMLLDYERQRASPSALSPSPGPECAKRAASSWHTLEELVDLRPTVLHTLKSIYSSLIEKKAAIPPYFVGEKVAHVPLAERRVHLLTHSCTEPETSGLMAVAKSLGVTVNTVMLAVAHLAIWAVFSPSRSIKSGVPVSLRKAAGLAHDYPGVFLGTGSILVASSHPIVALVEPDTVFRLEASPAHRRAFTDLCRHIQEQVSRLLASGTPAMTTGLVSIMNDRIIGIVAGQAQHAPSGRDSSLKISNIGPQPFQPSFDQLHVAGPYFASLHQLHGPPLQLALVTTNLRFRLSLLSLAPLIAPPSASRFFLHLLQQIRSFC